MKKIKLLLGALLLIIISTGTNAQKASTLEITFDYSKQPGPGSNQYAIWVENAQNEVVRTLFVTSFTTKGRARDNQKTDRGYRFRPTCVPTWVKHIDADKQTDNQIDGYTGATPQESGLQKFVWDFKNQEGQLVKSGTYKIYIEATYFNNGIVTYIGQFTTEDKAGNVECTKVYSDESVETHKDMIQNVNITLK